MIDGYVLCSWRWSSSIQSAKIRPRADYGSDHELLIVKYRLKLKKVGKTTRSFRNDLNQSLIIYRGSDRFMGLDLIDRVPEELWMEVPNKVQEMVTKTIPKKKKCKKAKWPSKEALQIAEKRSERQRRKGKTCPTECRVPENSEDIQESLLMLNNAKK